jgi:hypothetical protein
MRVLQHLQCSVVTYADSLTWEARLSDEQQQESRQKSRGRMRSQKGSSSTPQIVKGRVSKRRSSTAAAAKQLAQVHLHM